MPRDETTYYSIGRDGEFDEHATLDAAEEAAGSALEACREDAWSDSEWPEDVDGIKYGILLPVACARAVDVVKPTDDSEGSCDYALLPSGVDAASRIVDLERQLAEAKTERDYWRKKHKEDNEGLMFQLGRNLEFAQAAAFRHGATEPHPTIKCIQIIDEHAESLRHQLADREDAIRKLHGRVSDLEDELRQERSANDDAKDYDFPCGY